MRAQTPAGLRPPCRSRSSWALRVWLNDSMIWRNGFRNRCNGRVVFSDLIDGRIRVIPTTLSSASNAFVAGCAGQGVGDREPGWCRDQMQSESPEEP